MKRTSVPHPPARRCRNSRDEAHSRLVARIVLPQEIRRVLLGRPANLANHDHPVRLLIFQEDFQAINEIRPAERVPPDAHDQRLPEPGLRGLVDGFVGEGSGAGDDADAAAPVDEAGHDADFALAGGDYAGAVGADEARFGLCF